MRSAERLSSKTLSLTVAAATLLAGCGSVGMRLRDALPGGSASTSTPASAPVAKATTGSATPVAAAPRAASTGPIAPATQRAYDDALALMRAGHPADAERMLRALTQSDPDLAGPHANLGVIARQNGHLSEAVAELAKATTLAPGMAVAWNQLGLAQRQNGEFTRAKDAYEHALAIDPNYAAAVLNLGVLDDLYLGDSVHALTLYTRYLALTPGGDPVVTKWVADVKNRQPKAAAPAASAAAPATVPKEKS